MEKRNGTGGLNRVLFVFFVLSLFLMPDSAFAHTRRFVFSEEYQTIPQGVFELENWVKLEIPNQQVTNANNFEFQEELEYGVTDHWVVAHYERWERVNRVGAKDSADYKGFKFETKYRIGEQGKYWLDPLLYLEWVTDVQNKSNPNKIEAKIILSKTFGNLNFTYNQIMESRLGGGGRTEHNFTFGTTYEFPYEISAGVEMKGDLHDPERHRNKLSLGPTLSWQGKYFWVTLGVVFGVNRAAKDIEPRVVAGVPF